METTRRCHRSVCVTELLIFLGFFSCFIVQSESGKISLGRRIEASNHLVGFTTLDEGRESCESHAVKGHCSFYSCLDNALQCQGSNHNRSVAYRFCDKTRHHYNEFSKEGRLWAHKTNRCLLKKIATDSNIKREMWCSNVDKSTKNAFVKCARDADICKVLWTDREVIHKTFSNRHWLTVVEAAKECPRNTVNTFIFWILGQMHIYKR